MHEAVHLFSVAQLRDPVLIAGFESQFGTTAVATIRQLVSDWDAELLAEIDADEFFDFTVRRPMVRRDDGRTFIQWPSNRLYLARLQDRDVILLDGTEPSVRWSAFAEAVSSLCQQLGVTGVLMLGVEQGNVPHTRPRPVRLVGGLAAFPTLSPLLHLEPQPVAYEGPVGIASVLSERLENAGIETGTLQAMVPGYVQGSVDPQAALAFVRALDRALGTDTAAAGLHAEAVAFDEQLRLAMEQTPPLAKTVAWFEQQFDWLSQSAQAPTQQPRLPSSADVVADVERLLGERRGQTESAS